MIRTERNWKLLSIVGFLVFLFYMYIAYRTPLTHDDWTWGMAKGMERFHEGFKDYNGRYFGNYTELLITRVDWLRIFIMGLFGALLVVLPALIAKTNSIGVYLLSFLLFLTVPANMFAQTYGWAAGFSNYNTAAVCTLIFLLVVKNVFYDKTPKYSIWLTILMVPLGIISQLFVEHATLYNLIAAIFIIVWAFIRFRKFFWLHITYLVSTIIGAFIMFSNGAYAKIFSGEDTYRSVDSDMGIFAKMYDTFKTTMYQYLVMNNVGLNIVLAVIAIFILVKVAQNISTVQLVFKGFFIIVLTIYPLYQPVVKGIFDISSETTTTFEAYLSLLFYLVLVATVLMFIPKNGLKAELTFYLISVVTLAAPLFFVTPFGPRNFIICYMFFVLFAVRTVQFLQEEGYLNLRALYLPLFALVMAFVLAYSYVFTQIGQANDARVKSMKEQAAAGEKVIVVKRLPYQQYLWMSTPIQDGPHAPIFAEYYKLPSGVTLKIVPYKTTK
ncbi:DUF6056 family protein [Paenilisteria rocourtiae]|uniref:Glucosyltransferase GtrII-like protein n=2 Tax=Listeria rocourtiae TaxID=647910 RepID=A0A4R6ZQC4_9LIST|nr:DUF6056 family protein [Listeria rocourtiae]MBC1605808.1 hypothetical protein [Listeria rocourtiae]TDR54797.1 hypothetical protein DFP96_102392 [Listeria rocourtiae]